MVIADQEKAKIDDVLARAGHAPGSSGYIKNYQRAVGKVIKQLTAENMEQAEKMAKEWNDTHPPKEIQARWESHPMVAWYWTTDRTAEGKGWKFAHEFSKEMWKQCDTRVVVMAAWKGATGDVMYGLWAWLVAAYIITETHRHDFNDKLGDGKLFEGWDRVENKWEWYAHQVFGVEEESGEDTEGCSSKKDCQR